MVAKQLTLLLKDLHECKIIHQDIKPHNTVIGVGPKSKMLHLIDFGVSEYFVGRRGRHLPQVDNGDITGTLRYCSLNSHKGLSLSRRDDLESMLYMLLQVSLDKGTPWDPQSQSD